MEKFPGIWQIGIGEAWRRLFAKLVLKTCGQDAAVACGNNNLCAGLKAGIEGGIHAIQQIWDSHNNEEEWGFLLVDAKNAFNKLNRTLMLWTVRHLWPSGARFAFNCYKHHSTLILRSSNINDMAKFQVKKASLKKMY